VSDLKSGIPFSNPLFILIMLFACAMVVAIVGPHFAYGQFSSSSNANLNMSQKIGVKITSPKINQTVPIGELTIHGTSSDGSDTNCQVYVDWNDAKPMQIVTGVGPGGPNDYSNWTFTYTSNYHLISKGTNELTSKIICNGNSSVGNMTSKYYSINVTGSTNPSSNNFTTTSDTGNSANFTTGFQSNGHSPILPQYSKVGGNNSQYVNDKITNEMPKYTTNDTIDYDYSIDGDKYKSLSITTANTKADSSVDNNKGTTDNIKNKKIQSNTLESMMSLKVDDSKKKPNNFKFKLHYGNGNINSEELHKYIHNLIKKKLDRAYERLLD
jgi:hypothetical protein